MKVFLQKTAAPMGKNGWELKKKKKKAKDVYRRGKLKNQSVYEEKLVVGNQRHANKNVSFFDMN